MRWERAVWEKAVVAASNETGLEDFPESCLWSIEQIMDGEFLPG
ncbi:MULTISPECIES: DUF29 family protein [unclassified Caballeronia]|nr:MULTISPECIES: DUF29 family protein [unclassified Caballeronia]